MSPKRLAYKWSLTEGEQWKLWGKLTTFSLAWPKTDFYEEKWIYFRLNKNNFNLSATIIKVPTIITFSMGKHRPMELGSTVAFPK